MVLQARLTITGRVQGVGYRHWAMTTGLRPVGLTGWVRNRTDGSVEALIVGDDEAIGAIIDACRRGPAMAEVEAVESSRSISMCCRRVLGSFRRSDILAEHFVECLRQSDIEVGHGDRQAESTSEVTPWSAIPQARFPRSATNQARR